MRRLGLTLSVTFWPGRRRVAVAGQLPFELITEIRDVLAVTLRHECDEVLIRFEVGAVVSGMAAVQVW
jgi:hypothetical protein